MNNRIKNYIDVLFADIPRSKKAAELKEELTGNMNERFEDYLAQGMSEAQAYSQTVASMGDIDALLKEAMPDDAFRAEAASYKKRRARNTSIAVGLYILGAACVVASALLEPVYGDAGPVLGVVILLVLSAIATGMIVYTHMSTPREYAEYNTLETQDEDLYRSPAGKKLRGYLSIYWTVVTALYLLVSFLTFRWHITWIIWPVAGVLSGIIKTIFELREEQ